MDQTKIIALAEHRREMEREIPDASRALVTLERATLAPTRIEPTITKRRAGKTPRAWLVYCEPSKALRERFDLAPELLVFLSPAPTLQARDIERCERQLLRDLRLDRGLVVVLTRDPEADERLDQAIRATGRSYVFLGLETVDQAKDPQRWLRERLLESLGSADLFATGSPVFGWDFVGRGSELAALQRHLRRGRSVGLYGLRKIGKTSLLTVLRRRLIDEARAERRKARHRGITLAIHLDLQAISFAEQNRTGFARRLILATASALDDLGFEPRQLGLPPLDARALRPLDAPELERRAVDVLEVLIDWARKLESRILLVIDEYERLLSERSFPLDQGLDLFEYLRGLSQSHPEALSFAIAGLSRRLAASPELGGRRNPLFNFVVDHPLAGLGRDEHNELFRKIGRRLSLTFDPVALESLWRLTGGHPFLAREYGRLIDRQVPTSERHPKRVDPALVDALARPWRRAVRPTMEEIENTIREIDPRAPSALAMLHRTPDNTQALEALGEPTLDELERLGIVGWNDHRAEIRIGALGDWLAANWGDTTADSSAPERST